MDNLAKLQRIEADILKTVSDICEQQGIQYYLSSGTLLGAVRHQGFIPWDDDIDIMLTRPEYNRFLKEVGEKLPPYMELVHYTSGDTVPFCQAKVVDKRYQVMRQVFSDIRPYDVWIDVFPLDAVPQGRAAFFAHKAALKFHYILVKLARLNLHGNNLENRSTMEKTILKLNSKIHFSRLFRLDRRIAALDRCLERCSIANNKQCINFHGEYKFREMFPIQWLGQGKSLQFEDEWYRAPAQSEKYLTTLYHDFTQLPPEEQRVCKHSVEIMAGEDRL